MRIQELMSRNVLTCREGDSLERAANLMWDGDVGAVPVVDAEARVVGMITDRDICMAAYTQGCRLADRSVHSAMSRDVITCSSTDSASLAEEQMRRKQVRRLPVVDDGRLVGIVSLNDLALAAGNRKGAKASRISLEEVATSLARICEPRVPSKTAAE